MTYPEIRSYVDYDTKSYSNALVFRLDEREFYFSYKTLVAFRGKDGRLVVAENRWGPTTGRHLNAIDGGGVACKHRVGPEAFEQEWLREMATASEVVR